MAKEKTLEEMFYDIRKILRALLGMVRGAPAAELKKAFEKHRDQTQEHVERLQQVFEILGKRAQGRTCPAIDGLIEEGQEIPDEYKGTSALDAGLLAAAQAVQHYEITRYGTLRRWAEWLGMKDAVQLPDATLGEEARTDGALTKLPGSVVNQNALSKAA